MLSIQVREELDWQPKLTNYRGSEFNYVSAGKLVIGKLLIGATTSTETHHVEENISPERRNAMNSTNAVDNNDDNDDGDDYDDVAMDQEISTKRKKTSRMGFIDFHFEQDPQRRQQRQRPFRKLF